MSFLLRQPPSGHIITGENNGDSIFWNAATQLWEVGPGGGGAVSSVFGRTGDVVAETGDYDSDQIDNVSTVPGASVSDALETLAGDIAAVSLVNLPAVWYVAQGTTVAAPDQTGNIEAPFATLAQARAAAVAAPSSPKAIIIFPGDYSAEAAFVWDASSAGVLTLVNGSMLVGQFNVTNINVVLPAMTLTGIVNLAGVVPGDVTPGFSLNLSFWSCQKTTGTIGADAVDVFNSVLSCALNLSSIGSTFRESTLQDVTMPGGGESALFTNCYITGAITFTGDPGFAQFDDYTARQFALNGGASIVNGRINTTFPIVEDTETATDTLAVNYNEGGSWFRSAAITSAEGTDISITPPSYAHDFELLLIPDANRTISWLTTITWGDLNGALANLATGLHYRVWFHWNETRLYADWESYTLP